MDMEKVIEGLETIKQFFGYGLPSTAEMFDSYYGILNDAIAMLKEQEAKEGHWIVLEFCANEGIYCSKCMNKIFDRSTKPKKKLSNYCPNCGSKNTHFFNPSTEKIMYSD